MRDDKLYTKATFQIMEKLLEVDNLSDALYGTLEIIIRTLNSEAVILWYLDSKTGRLFPAFHKGPTDITGVSIEPTEGIPGEVISSGKTVYIKDASADPRFDGTVFDGPDFVTKTLLCVPLSDMEHSPLGCVEIINKLDGSLYTDEEKQLCERMAVLAAMSIEEKGFEIDTGKTKNVLVSLRLINP